VLILLYLLLHWIKHTPAAEVSRVIKKTSWIGLLLVVGLLIITGKLNAIFAGIGVAIVFVLRFAPLLLKYAPHVHELWSRMSAAKAGYQQSSGQSSAQRPGKTGISKAEALQILGLEPGASEAEIIAAHRKLIARLHPDKGGSNYLAAQINLAKKVLLGD
jgi:hypothetical protein